MFIIRSSAFFFAVNILLVVNTYAQTLTFAKSMGGISSDYGKSITTDASNNIYTAGYFTGTVDFDPGAGTNNVTSAGSTDIFIQKLDASGNFVWVKTIGLGFGDQAHCIVLDASGNIYVTGQYQGSVDFDPGVGTTTLTSTGGTNVFVLKLDASGNFVWAKSLGNGASSISLGRGIAVDNSTGSVYVTGSFTQTGDFDPGAGTANLSSGGVTSDVFVCSLTSAGNFAWAKKWGVTGNQDAGFSIAFDAVNLEVCITGDFNGTVDFDPGAGVYNMTSSGSYDGFISKLDKLGNFIWAQRWGSAGIIDRGHSVKCDGTNVYVGGRGDYAYVMKLNAGTGAFIWTKTLGSGSNDLSYGVDYDVSGNVYITGAFISTGDFDPGVGIYNLTAVGGVDSYFCKLDASGNFLCAYGYGGSVSDEGYSIDVDASNNVYTTGYFSNTVDFDPDITTANLTSLGNSDIYITKTIGCPVIVLPIELAYFEAVCIENQININWATYTQSDNKYFTIERSTDGVTFEAIAVIEGSDNLENLKHYNFIDHDHPLEDLYYRLKQTDFNGQYKYFNIEYVNRVCFAYDEEYSICPNPVTDKLNLKFQQKERQRLSYSIYNTIGHLIRDEINISSENGNFVIDVSDLQNGFYILNFTYGQLTKTIKFIKQ